MSLYVDIFTNSALLHSVIPYGTEAGLYAMKSFGHNMLPATAAATAGAFTGQLFNFLFGMGLHWLVKTSKQGLNEKWYKKVQGYFNKYGVFTLLLTWITLGGIIPIIAGFLRTPLKIALPLILVGLGAHYAMDLL